MGLDAGQNIAILAKSGEISAIQEKLPPATRFVIGYVVCNYITSNNFTINVTYVRGHNSVEETISYTVDKDETFFRQKLPPGIAALRFWVSISGSISDMFECEQFGVEYDTIKTGNRG